MRGLVTLMLAAAMALMGMATSWAASPSLDGLVSISPPVKQLTISSGLVQAESVVTLTNNTAYDFNVAITKADFTPLSDGTIVLGKYGPSGSQSGLAAWMNLPDGPNLTIKSGKQATVRLLIDNRSDLAPGGHYGALVFSTQQIGATGSNKVAFNQQLTSLFFVKKLGGDIAGMALQSLETDTQTGLPTTVVASFKSTGNVYVVPRGYVEVKDARGKLVAKGQINPQSSLVPQGTTRTFDTILKPVENVQATGRLKLTAYYRFDGKNDFSTRSILLGSSTSYLKKPIFVFSFIVGLMIVLYSLVKLFRHVRRPKFSARG